MSKIIIKIFKLLEKFLIFIILLKLFKNIFNYNIYLFLKLL